MIDVVDNKHCCGCAACQQACPKHCIDFITDSEGFDYPKVDETKCIDCGVCEKVCPMLVSGKTGDPLSVEAMRFHDEQKRTESSSGGAFTAIAEAVLRKGGVVFGAAYKDDWQVETSYTESVEGLAKFRGSKYVQCHTGNTYSLVKDFLRQNRLVLFSGTPCQVRGLLLYLRKPYENLLTTDFICHGVPSHAVFKAYLKDEIKKSALTGGKNTVSPSNAIDYSQLSNVLFRDKTHGWKKFSFALECNRLLPVEQCVVPGQDSRVEKIQFRPRMLITRSAYMAGFGANLYLRPSCHECPAKNFSSGSDFTLADYWGIDEQHPEMDDDRGTSLVAVHSQKAMNLLSETLHLERKSVEPKAAYKLQFALFRSLQPSRYRAEFWESDWQNDFCNVVWRICKRRSVGKRMIESVKWVLRTLGVKKMIKKIRKKRL